MKYRPLSPYLSVVVCLLTLVWPLCGAANHKFVWLSDLHFDPTASPALIDKLAAAEITDWPSILATPLHPLLSRYSEDTNWPLLLSARDAVRSAASDADFTVVTGDVLVHHFREKYEAAATDKSPDGFRRFAGKTLQFVAAQLQEIRPDRPVFLALGNNDSECGDYATEPGGAFLADSSAAIARLLGKSADAGALADWRQWGSYDVPHPTLRHTRLIVVNSVYFSPRYHNACSENGPDPGLEQMQWLKRKVSEAAQRHEKVWLLFHIPPGIDGFATARQKANGTPKTVYMWKPEFTAGFDQLVTTYQKTVTVSLAGHEHMDDFRLLSHSLVLLAPGLSPVVGQNPAFRIASLNTKGELTDEDTYFLSNLDATDPGVQPRWELEYNFLKDWKLRPLNFENYQSIYRSIEQQGTARARWSALYSVSRAVGGSITPVNFSSLFCASGNLEEKNFKECVMRLAMAAQ